MDANETCPMNKCIGLWIDEERAVIIFPTLAGEETRVILSEPDRQPGQIDGERSTALDEALITLTGDGEDGSAATHLHRYYDEVIDCVREAGSLLVFGPGEAKSGLAKRLSQQEPTARSVNVEPADRMTYRQIAAKVREHFREESPVMVMR